MYRKALGIRMEKLDLRHPDTSQGLGHHHCEVGCASSQTRVVKHWVLGQTSKHVVIAWLAIDPKPKPLRRGLVLTSPEDTTAKIWNSSTESCLLTRSEIDKSSYNSLIAIRVYRHNAQISAAPFTHCIIHHNVVAYPPRNESDLLCTLIESAERTHEMPSHGQSPAQDAEVATKTQQHQIEPRAKAPARRDTNPGVQSPRAAFTRAATG